MSDLPNPAKAAALSQSAGVADGWKLVPREPSEAMLDAMHERIRILCDPARRTADIQNDREVWAAMLAAAPAAQQTAGVAAPGRYFADGPQGHFFADDLQLARDLVNLYDKDDDWTITDLCNPTGVAPPASGGEYPGCSGDPASCPENEGHGCCKPNPARHVAIVCDWKNADPFPTFIEAEIGGKSVSLEWRDRPDGLKELIVPVTAAPQPPSDASVSERARELLAAEYRTHGWHEDAGRLCMGGDPTSFVEDDALRVITRLIEQGDEDTHVITELGRLLAGIAVILKGPEPAGTAWSYHDLPELVASALSEPRQVAAEMKAWAHTKMAEQQSSRRDRMMVAEWAKRLLPESSFPVKDFDVEGMSITKEAAREAVKQVALEQSLTQQRGEASYDAGMAMHWIERYAAGIDEECQLDRIAEAFTTPSPAQTRCGVGEAGCCRPYFARPVQLGAR
ncbi:MAG: hypothetical protein HZT39_09605 [Pseudoxanthomonas sp.]|nr:MAG: hypothetical protein HZT39_09605 [Pseudoxanthomonas sp.]